MTLPTLQQLYEEQDARWLYYHVWVGGALLPSVTSVSYSFAFGQAPAATIVVPISDLPAAVEPEAAVEIWIGYRVGLVALESLVFGCGIVDGLPDHNNADCTIHVAMDTGRRLQQIYNRTLSYNFFGKQATQAVTELLGLAGIQNFVVSLPAWVIGVSPFPPLQFTSWGEAVNKVATVDGSPWYCMPGGQVRVDLRDPFPSATWRRQYFSGVLTGAVETQPDGISNPAARPRILDGQFTTDRSSVANWVEIDGAAITETGARGQVTSNQIIADEFGDSGLFANGAPWVPIPPTYQQMTYSNELLASEPKVASVAARYYDLGNRLIEKGQITVPLDPNLFLGFTAKIVDPRFSGADDVYFLYGYSCTLEAGRAESVLQFQRGTPSGTPGTLRFRYFLTPPQPPFADFTWSYSSLAEVAPTTLFTFNRLVLGWQAGLAAKLCTAIPSGTGSLDAGTALAPGADLATAIIVDFDGSMSDDFDGHLVAWEWSDTLGHSGSGPHVTFAYDPGAANVVDVTLEVVDNDGLTASITKTVALGATYYVDPTLLDPTLNDTLVGGGVALGHCTLGGSQMTNGGGGGGGGSGLGAFVPPQPNSRETGGAATVWPPAVFAGPGGANGMATGLVAAAAAWGMASPDGVHWVDLLASDTGATGSFISVGCACGFAAGLINILYGSDAGEIVLSSDFNKSGTVVFRGQGRIECITVDSHEAGRVWAGSSTGQIYSSTDQGQTWSLYHDFGDGWPIYVIGTPARFFESDNLSLWVFGGDASDPSTLVRIDGAKSGQFVSLPFGRDLLSALAAAGSGAVRTASMNQTSSLLGFTGAMSPPLWTASDPLGDPETWTPTAGEPEPARSSAPGRGGDYMVSANLDVYSTQDNVNFSEGSNPTAIHHMLWQGLGGLYVAAGQDGLLLSTDSGASWGFLRPNATFGSSWPGGAAGQQIAFIIFPRAAAAVGMGSFGDAIVPPD